MTNPIYVDDLSHALQKIGLASRQHIAPEQTHLAQGNLNFVELQKGFNLHQANIIETGNNSSSSMLPAGFHVTVLFSGQVSFRVAHKLYHFSADDGPVALVNVINQQEIFTRYMKHQQAVDKVTVSAEKSWLVSKMQSEPAMIQINQHIFHRQGVYVLPMTSSLLAQAKLLTQPHKADQYLAPLVLEQHTLSLLYSVLTQFYNEQSPPHQAKYLHAQVQASEEKLAHLLTLIDEDVTLTDIATQLGVSVSTLQRRFKGHFRTTLKQYVKQRRLEKAKKALLIDGLTIGEAAYLAKYTHVGNFITAFKKHFNITPMQLIKLHRNNSLYTPEYADPKTQKAQT